MEKYCLVLKELPEDQQRLIRLRLSAARIKEIEAEAKDLTSFYSLCIRDMHEEEPEREEWWNK